MSRHGIGPTPERATAATEVQLERRVLTDFLLDDTPRTAAWTNVPVTVIQHSPGGFEWGYGGSGPSDLALNILNWFVPPRADGYPPVKCFQGFCSRTAWTLHHDFKQQWIATVSQQQGGILKGVEILEWIARQQFCAACGRLHRNDIYLPRCECGHRLKGECDCSWCRFGREEEESGAEEAAEPCGRCAAPLQGGCCSDLTCPFSDHFQECPAGWAAHPEQVTALCSCRSRQGERSEEEQS